MFLTFGETKSKRYFSVKVKKKYAKSGRAGISFFSRTCLLSGLLGPEGAIG